MNEKVILVTGSSRGIGKEIAKVCAQNGANVVITYKKNAKKAFELSEEIKNSLVVKLDITSKKSIKIAIKKILKKYHRIDVLVNNAGINNPTDFEKISESEWDKIMNTNLKGSFLITQQIFPIMKKQKFGRIINIASVSGQYGGPRTVHYAVSKAGLISLGHCFARFGAEHNITSNNISPGIISTDMSEKILFSKMGKKILNQTLLKKAGKPKDVANLVLFLSSDEASYITGQTFNVNGGLIFS